MTKLNFTTKEEYLAWTAEWKEKYAALSTEIRRIKGTRKMFNYTYREKGDNSSQKRTKFGSNPHYDPRFDGYSLGLARDVASSMMEQRAAAKKEAERQYKKSKLEMEYAQ